MANLCKSKRCITPRANWWKQSIGTDFLSTGRGSTPLTYVDIPDADVSGTSATLTYAAPGNILNTTGGDTQNKKISGIWREIHPFSLVGVEGTPRKISNLDGNSYISTNAASAIHVFSLAGTTPDWFEVNGLSAAAPFYLVYESGTVPTSGIQVSASAATPHAVFQNIVNATGGYGFFANSAGVLSGGDANTPCVSDKNYHNITLRHFRSFNPLGNKENYYIGATTTTTYAIHHNLVASHLLGYNPEWDGAQFGNCIDANLSNLTLVNSGTDDLASQNAAIQLVNFSGTLQRSIFYNSPEAMRLSGYDIIIDNIYLHWTDDIGIEILDYVANYAEDNRLFVDPTGLQILFRNCDFVGENRNGALLEVFDGKANITVENCRIAGPTSLFGTSGRASSPTGVLTDGGGNTYVAGSVIRTPTFTNFDHEDFQEQGLLTESTHHALGRGNRTPAAA